MNSKPPQPPNKKTVITLFVVLGVLLGISFFISSVIPRAENPSGGNAELYSAANNSQSEEKSEKEKSKTIAYKVSDGNLNNELRYDQLLTLVNGPNVKKIELAEIGDATGDVKLIFKDDSYVTSNYSPDNLNLSNILVKAGAEVNFKDNRGIEKESGGSIWGTVITFALIGGFILLIMFLARRSQKQMMGMNKGKHAVVNDKYTGVYFKDVAGCDEAIEEVSECVDFLKDPGRFKRLGAKMPAGIILHGPPGTGKTMIAKALASEAGVPFYSTSGSEFVEMFVGVGAGRVRELFDKAREEPDGAVIFIDEIDAIGGKRNGSGSGHNNEEREQTLNQLLVQLDGFHGRDNIIVVAATNRLDTLDPALLRAGRLTRKIPVPLPSESGRLQILKVHCQGKPLDKNVDLESLARITYGSSGADLADMVNEAAILAARHKHLSIKQEDLSEGHLRALAGPEKADNNVSQEEKEIIAFHEAGHVLCAELSETHEKAQRATIKQRTSGAGGLALFGQNDRLLHSTRYFHEKIVCALGGRAAEKVVFGVVSSGAANDLQQANALARSAVQELGFSQRAGQLIHDANSPLSLSDQTKAIADEEVERIVDEAFQEAVQLLETHIISLQNLAGALLEYEDIDRTIIEETLRLDDTLEDWQKHRVSSGSFGVRAAPAPSSSKSKENNETPAPEKVQVLEEKVLDGLEPVSTETRTMKRRKRKRFGGLALPFEVKLTRKPKGKNSNNHRKSPN